MKKSAWPKGSKERYLAHETELKWLHRELYHDESAYEEFVSMLCRLRVERPRALVLRDRKRADDCAGIAGRGALGMQIDPRDFPDGLSGLRAGLAPLAAYGVKLLRLPPLSDDEETMRQLRALAEDCRGRGIAVCPDLVMDRCAAEHAWARRARAGEKAARERFFFFDDRKIPAQFEETMPRALPGAELFSPCGETGTLVMSSVSPGQWDLNYADPAVFRDMTETLLRLCNSGAGAVCLVGAPGLWKELGTSCRDLPQAHTLLRMLRIACEIVCPGTTLIAALSSARAEAYLGTPARPECHMILDSAAPATIWHTVATRDVRLLRGCLGRLASLPHERPVLLPLRVREGVCPDELDYGALRAFGAEKEPHRKYLIDYLTGKWLGSPARGTLLPDGRLGGTSAELCGAVPARRAKDPAGWEQTLRLDVTLHALLLTMNGIGMLCGGDVPLPAPGARPDPGTAEERVGQSLRRLAALRAAHRAFDAEADCWTMDIRDQGILGVGRYREGEKLIALFNFTAESKRVSLQHEEGDLFDLLDGLNVNKRCIQLPPYGFAWLLCDFTGKENGKKRKLIFLNTDALREEHGRKTLPEELRGAIRAAQRAGHKAMLCSESGFGALALLTELGFDGAIAENGGYIVLDGEVIFDYPMGRRQCELLLHLLRESGIPAALETKDARYGDKAFAAEDGEPLRPLEDYDGRAVYRILFSCADRARLEGMIAATKGEYELALRDADAPESGGALRRSKYDVRSGMRFAADALGIAPEDMIALGSASDGEVSAALRGLGPEDA